MFCTDRQYWRHGQVNGSHIHGILLLPVENSKRDGVSNNTFWFKGGELPSIFPHQEQSVEEGKLKKGGRRPVKEEINLG